MRLAAIAQRGDEQFAAVENSFDLQAHEFILTLAQRARRRDSLGLDEFVDVQPKLPIADADESPRLHEAHTRRQVGRRQQSCD